MKAPAPHAREHTQIYARPHRPLCTAVGATFVLGQISDPVKFFGGSSEIHLVLAVRRAKFRGPQLNLVFTL